jgi:REP element-mobilizing transposase RayT
MLCGSAHVTMKLLPGLPNLRTQVVLRECLDIFRTAKRRFGCHLQHFCILSNHVHFVIHARDSASATRAMQGLAIRIAKRLNKIWKRRGKVFADRFFLRPLVMRPAQIRRALVYVLQNARKHGIPLPSGMIDRYSSGRWFDGWKGWQFGEDPDPPISDPDDDAFKLWRRLGGIGLDEVPPGKNPAYWRDEARLVVEL